MGNFKPRGGSRFGEGRRGGFGGRDGGRSSFGGGDRRDRGPVTMHQAVCDQCGKTCEVPFRPTTGKPVYCNACFGSKKEMGGGDRFSQKNFGSFNDSVSDANKGNNNELKNQLEALNVKMDKLIRLIESMTIAKPAQEEVKVKSVIKAVSATKAKKSVKKASK